MRSLVLFSALSFSAASLAQDPNDILYYKFDERGGDRVINYASGSGRAPVEGAVLSTDTTAFAPGRMGASALRGGGPGVYSVVDSGWNGAFTGSFTVAWFMKNRNPTTSLSYYFSGVGSFRCFTNGVAGQGLYLRAWGGTPTDLILPTNVQAPSATNWLHVALVVDADPAVMEAVWYLNGVPDTRIPITAGASVTPGTRNFHVAQHTSTVSVSFWDLDEFRFYNRAASAAEVRMWASATSAADSRYGAGCGARLTSSGGPPALGTPGYALELVGAATTPFVLALGTNRLQLGPIALPLDLGVLDPGLANCDWETSSEIFLVGTTGAGGSATIPLPIPNDPALDAAVVYVQGLLLGTPLQSSNPFAIGIGQ